MSFWTENQKFYDRELQKRTKFKNFKVLYFVRRLSKSIKIKKLKISSYLKHFLKCSLFLVLNRHGRKKKTAEFQNRFKLSKYHSSWSNITNPKRDYMEKKRRNSSTRKVFQEKKEKYTCKINTSFATPRI